MPAPNPERAACLSAPAHYTMKFKITDLTTKRRVCENFLDKTISVESHSGLHTAEKALIKHLNAIALGQNLLIAGNRTGVIAMIAARMHPDSKIVCHTQDIHHAWILCRNLESNHFNTDLIYDNFVKLEEPDDEPDEECDDESTEPPVEKCIPDADDKIITVACTTKIPGGDFDSALFMITPTTITGELSLDLLENIQQVLKIKGQCLIAYDGESHALTTQLKSIFDQVQTLEQSRKGGTVFLVTKKSDLAKPRNFLASFEASLPGGEKITLESLPGIFCHRRPDNGGLALAEIAATMLESKMHVMDMGCGCGIVGLLLAHKQPDIEVTFIDSHARALDVTNRNIKALAVPATQLILSDNGTSQTGYDMFVGNPPYYSDYRIAEVFIDQAYESLKEKGIALIVTKQTTQVGDLMYAKFGNIDVIPRRGYSVITVKR